MAFHWVIFIFVISFGMHKILIVYISLSLFFPSQIFRFLFLLCLWVMQAIRLRHSGAARPSTTDKTEDPRMQKKNTHKFHGEIARADAKVAIKYGLLFDLFRFFCFENMKLRENPKKCLYSNAACRQFCK